MSVFLTTVIYENARGGSVRTYYSHVHVGTNRPRTCGVVRPAAWTHNWARGLDAWACAGSCHAAPRRKSKRHACGPATPHHALYHAASHERQLHESALPYLAANRPTHARADRTGEVALHEDDRVLLEAH